MTAAAVAPGSAARRVCFFGTYAREHTTTLVLRQALLSRGCEVVECHVPLWEETRDKMPAYFGARSLARLAAGYARRMARLARALRRQPFSDVFIVGFNGQLDVLALRLLRRGARILFAPLVTISETLIDDRRVYSPGSLMGRAVRQIDRLSLRLADRILIDTEAHRHYLIGEHRVPPERVACWYLGADREVFRPIAPRPRAQMLRVLFFGQFLPLHGIDTIFRAIATLAQDDAYEFTIIGTGPERARASEIALGSAARHVRFVDWVPYPELGRLAAEADVCLGSFGTSRKAEMVIPNKVFQAAAVGRPVVTAETPALREVFRPGEDIVACRAGDSASLAGALRSLRSDDLRLRIASRAQRLMSTRFSAAEQSARLAAAVHPLVDL